MAFRTIGILLLCVILPAAACSVIAGKDDGDPALTERQLRLSYVETLRDQASLRGESLREMKTPADAASAAQMLQRPSAVFADNYRVYVVDRHPSSAWPGRLSIFDRGLRTMTTVTILPIPPVSANDRLVDPSGVTLDGTGLIYIAEPRSGKVYCIDRSGLVRLTYGLLGDLSFPAGVAADPVRSRIYIADKSSHRVKVYGTTGVLLFELGGSGKEGELRSPISIAVDRDGICSVLGAGKVHQFDASGRLLRSFPVKGGATGGPRRLTGIAVDSAGHLYVSDAGTHSVLIFDKDGTFLQQWGSGPGSRRDEFWHPAGIFIDSQDLIYVADQMNSRVQVYQYRK